MKQNKKKQILSFVLVLAILLSVSGVQAIPPPLDMQEDSLIAAAYTEQSEPIQESPDMRSLWQRLRDFFGRGHPEATSNLQALSMDMGEVPPIVDPIIESYIREHYNEAFTSLDDMRLINFMHVKNLIIDDTLRGGMTTIDEIMEDILQHPEIFITQTVGAVPVFELSADSDYYVAFINTMLGDLDTQTLDYVFALLNNQGMTVEGHYDFETGIAYIPRHVMRDEYGRLTLFEIQAQLLQSSSLAHSRSGEMLPLASSYFVTDATRSSIARGASIAHVDSQNLFTFTTTVQAEHGLNPTSVSILVNGLIVPSDMYHYDPSTGIITLLQSSGSIFSIQVLYDEVPETGFIPPEARNIFTMPTHGAIALTPSTVVGSSAMMNPRFVYTDGMGHLNVNNVAMYPQYTNAELGRLANDILNNGVNTSELVVANQNLLLVMHLYFEEGHTYGDLFRVVEGNTHHWGVDFLVTSLICAHITTSLGSIGSVPQNVFVEGGIGAFARILALTDSYVLIGFVTQEANSQASLGVLRFNREPPDLPGPGTLRIIKTSESGNVSGIQFRVTGPGGFNETLTTGANGTITIPDIQPGTYTVTEINIPSNYEPQPPQTVTVVEGQTAEVTFHNRLTPGDPGIGIRKTSDSGNIVGIRFHITGPDGFDQIVTTGPGGIIDILDLQPGSYTITELDLGPEYEPQAPRTFTLMPNEFFIVRFHNVLRPPSEGALRIIKTSESGNVVGIQFHVAGPGISETVTTGAGGVITIPGLQPGTFVVTEISPGLQYHPQPPQSVTVRVDETAEVHFHNVEVRGIIGIEKVSANAPTTSGNSLYSLEGAVFGVYASRADATADTNRVWTLTTDSAGRAQQSDVRIGTWYIRELTPSPGFDLDPAIHVVTVTPQNHATVQVARSYQPPRLLLELQMQKMDAGGGTGPQGSAIFAGAQYTLQFFPGVAAGQTPSGTPLMTLVYRTDAQGRIDLSNPASIASGTVPPQLLQAGRIVFPLGAITLQETLAPTGYLIDNTVHLGFIVSAAPQPGARFEWAAGSGTQIRYIPGTGIQHDEEGIRGGVEIEKRDRQLNVLEILASIVGRGAQGDGTLAGTAFEITNENPNPVFVYGQWIAPGAVVTTIVAEYETRGTSLVAVARTTQYALPWGAYSIREVRASTGYNLTDGEARFFYIRDHGVIETGTVEDEEIIFTNYVIRGDVRIEKWDIELNAPEAIGGRNTEYGTSLAGIQFTIWNRSPQAVLVDGGLIAPDEIVAVLYTFWCNIEESYIAETTGRLLPFGTYETRETATNDSYLLTDGEPRTFTIRTEGELVTVDTDGRDLVWQNQVIRGDIEFVKRAIDSERPMPYVPFVITNLTTGEAHVIVTDRYGVFNSAALQNTHNTNGNNWLLCIADCSCDEDAPECECEYECAHVCDEYCEDGCVYECTHECPPLDTPESDDAGYENSDIDSTGTLRLRLIYDDADEDKEENGEYPSESSLTRARVVRVIDGDTIVLYGGYRVRLIGVDAPEFDDAGGLEATLFVRKLVEGNYVYLESEGRDQDAFGRYRRYVWLTYPSNVDCPYTIRTEMLNALLLEAGHAEVSIIVAGEVRHEALFRRIAAGDVEDIVCTCDDDQAPGYVHSTDFPSNDALDVSFTIHEPKAIDPTWIMLEDMDPTAGVWFGLGAFGSNAAANDALGSFPFGRYSIRELRAETNLGFYLTEFEFEITEHGATILIGNEAGVIYNEPMMPEIGTTAWCEDTKTNMTFAGDMATVWDTVHLTGFARWETYVVRGILMNRETGEPFLVNGEPIENEVTFVAEWTDMDIDIPFTFDASALVDSVGVFFERLYLNGNFVTSHEDLDAESQWIRFPWIGTQLFESETGESVFSPDECISLTDVVMFRYLIPGLTYAVRGWLMDYSTGEPLLIDGEMVRGETTFVPETEHGYVDVVFEFDARGLENTTLVAFESLYFIHDPEDPDSEESLIAEHHDLECRDQTVWIPYISTYAFCGATGHKFLNATETAIITDRVTHYNLVPGLTYRVRGILMNRETGEPLLVDGQTVTAEADFIPTSPDGYMELDFRFDARQFAAQDLTTVVVFQRMYVIVGSGESEAPPSDEGAADGEEVPPAGDAEEDSDEPDAGDPEDTEAPAEDDEEADDTTPDRPSRPDGDHIGRLRLVAVHEDIYDEGQTVFILQGNMWSNARVFSEELADASDAEMIESGSQYLVAEPEAQIIDFVSSERLRVGERYVLRGVLMDRESNEPLRINDREVTSEVYFTATESAMTIRSPFTFDARGLEGQEIVIFQRLYHVVEEAGEVVYRLVGIDEYINNANQMVRVRTTAPPEPTPPGTSTNNPPVTRAPQTGDDGTLPWLPFILSGFGVSLIGAIWAVNKVRPDLLARLAGALRK